jgi:hypothetical protein
VGLASALVPSHILDLLILPASSFCTIYSTLISFSVYSFIYSSTFHSPLLSHPVLTDAGFGSDYFFVTASNHGWFKAYYSPIRFLGSGSSSWFMRSFAYELTDCQMPSLMSYSPRAVRRRVYSMLWCANASFPLSLRGGCVTGSRGWSQWRRCRP